MTFVLLDIFGVSYNAYVEEWGMTFDDYNNISAANYAGLGVGCVLFIPLAYKFGRRLICLVNLMIQLATAIWEAKASGVNEMVVLNLIQGLGGAISETLVQMIIADLFFVHQYATMNGLFLLMQSIGAFLGPVAAGYVVVSQGWRWQWWWCAIFLGVSLVSVFFFFEETAYVPTIDGTRIEQGNTNPENLDKCEDDKEGHTRLANITSMQHDTVVPTSSWSERLRLYTKTPDSVGHHVWQPFVLLLRVPAVAYTALTYGMLLANFAVIGSVNSGWLFNPPYNFDPIGVGLFNIAPFIGALIASVVVAPLSDRLVIQLAVKNGGIYEAEMRLWPAIPTSLLACGGLLLYGISIAQVRMASLLQKTTLELTITYRNDRGSL